MTTNADNDPSRDDEEYCTMFDLFMHEIDYDAMPDAMRKQLSTVLMMLLACVEDDRINTDKLAELTARVAGGRAVF